MGYRCLITFKRVLESQRATIQLSWTNWSRHWSQNGGRSCQKNCYFSRTTPPHAWLPSPRGNWLICTFKCWNTLPIHLIWRLRTAICSQTCKKKSEGCRFFVIENVISAAQDWFAAKPSTLYLEGLMKLEQKSNKCVKLRGKYVKSVTHCLVCKAKDLSAFLRIESLSA
jgi:hypothetical protein